MGGGKGGNTTTSSFKPPEEFMKAYKESLDMARNAANQPYEQYQGQLVAGLTPTQQQGIANINAAQGMALPAIQKGMDYTRQAARGITPDLYNRFYSPYVKDVANTTFANLMESQAQQQSGLKSGAIQAGAFGGDRGGVAQAEMARQQQLANAMAMSNIYNQGYGQAMGLAGQQVANLSAQGQQMAALGAGAQGSVLQGAQAQMAAGAQQQATKQAELQAAYQQWMQHQAYPYQQAQFFANIAQGLGAGAGGTSSTTQPAPNLWSQIFGGIGAIGSIYGASDKRVKENIQEVGKLNDGQTIYRYNFKGDPKTQIGLLAQEVEHKKPGAVAQVKGLKMVDYKGATDDAAALSSMGGVVSPGMDRQGLAGGGIPYYPYEDAQSYVPEGKIGSRGSTIPSAPKGFEDKGLAEDWKDIMPISSEQAAGLRAMAEDVGLELPSRRSVSPLQASSGGLMGFSNGGTAARTNYADGGVGAADYPVAEEEVVYDIPAGLAAAESGNDFGAQNEQGYVGRLQFGTARLEDAKRAGVIPVDMTPEDFRNNPEAQKATERWHLGDINEFIDKSGLGSVEGKKINGVPVTREGLVRVAHLGGKGGLQKFVASGGAYNPADANGTRLSDYLALASNAGVAGGDAADKTGVAAAADIPDPNAPVESGYVVKGEKPGLKFDMSKLFASDENPSVIEKIMGRRLSPEARSAVLNASFALMAGRSPFFFTNLGEAGKIGTQTYYNALQQNRELSKQQAEIGLTQQERDIQRTNAVTARINAARQLYAQMLPQIKFWQMRNPGKPLPPEYRRVIDAAYPPEGPAGLIQAPGLPPEISGRAPAAPEISGDSGIATAPAVTVPPAEGAPTTEEAETISASVSSGNTELDKMYAQLPNELNPNYWTQMAESAMTSEDYTRASQRAAELTKQYQESGIPLPSGLVPFPGSIEMETQKIGAGKAKEADVGIVSDLSKQMSDMQSGFSSRTMIVDGLRDSLSTAETGKFAELKTDIVNAMNSFGLANADMVEEAADLQTAMKYFAQSILDSGMKDKIGPQISNADLNLVAKGQGTIENLPAANRRIIGAMYGKLLYDKAKAEAWDEYISEKGGIQNISASDSRQWQRKFGEENPIGEYVKRGIAETPVAGELSVKRPSSYFKEGYKYVDPKNGRTFVVKGFKKIGEKTVPDLEYVQ